MIISLAASSEKVSVNKHLHVQLSIENLRLVLNTGPAFLLDRYTFEEASKVTVQN